MNEQLRNLLAGPDREIDLAHAALEVARIEYPELNPEETLARLDQMASAIRAQLGSDAKLGDRLAALNRWLFAQQGYAGDLENYYDPLNSCLNAVIERRRGIPISLSILYIELGRRLDIELEGVSFPGHFLVRAACDVGLIVLDPYYGGRTLSLNDLRKRLEQQYGPDAADSAQFGELLQPAENKRILVRLINNLRQIYQDNEDVAKSIQVIDLLLTILPETPPALRERGMLYRRMECYRAALSDLSRYLEMDPDANDAVSVRNVVVELAHINARMN